MDADLAARAVAQTMGALQSHTTSNAATMSQHAALAALTDVAAAEPAIAAMVAQFRARRDAALAVLDAARVKYVRPGGAFYLYINVGRDAGTFATELMDRHGVAVVTGAAFLTPNWIRASYAAPMETVVEGVKRIVELIGR